MPELQLTLLRRLTNGYYDWRGPVADRLYLPTAEGGSCFSDALTVATQLVAVAHALAGLEADSPKNGARYHWSQPGSVQSFTSESLTIRNVEWSGEHGLLLRAEDASVVNGDKEVEDAKGTDGSDGGNGLDSANSGNGLDSANGTNGANGTDSSDSANNLDSANDSDGINGASGANRADDTNGAGDANDTHRAHRTDDTNGAAAIAEASVETFRASGAGGAYGLVGNPTIFPGQTLRAQVRAETRVEVAFSLGRYDANDQIRGEVGPFTMLEAGQSATLQWRVPDFDGQPIARVGLQLRGVQSGDAIWISSLTWDGEPDVQFHAPAEGGKVWKRAWVDAVDGRIGWENQFHVLVQNRGRGLISTGTAEWKNYCATARFKLRAARGGGLAVRYGGLERYYGLMLRRPGTLVLFKRRDGVETTLGEVAFKWEYEPLYDLFLSADGPSLTAGIGDQVLLSATDPSQPFTCGGIALLIEEGCLMAERVRVAPLDGEADGA